VGLGTFRPVKVKDIAEHKMHAEYAVITRETAETVNAVREAGGRVIAVGTTACRTLEAFAGPDGRLSPCAGYTDIFIFPGYRFRAIDGLITNFHLPCSTLLMLVSALAGREFMLDSYREAIEERYRFFSFGDAMLIV
jgi:S-adenosylmethionine:tRNA ribosyltransferase-isomerase